MTGSVSSEQVTGSPACIIAGDVQVKVLDNYHGNIRITYNPPLSNDNTSNTVRVENFEVVLISRFSWVADDTKIIHVEGGINTREIF